MDALQAGTQLNGRSEMVSMDDASVSEEGEELFTLHDVLSNDDEDPSAAAARRLDWEAFCKPLGAARVAVLEGIAQGRTLRDVGQQRGVGDSAMQHHRLRLEADIRDFMGDDILRELAKTPAWKNGLMANRQRGARKVVGRSGRNLKADAAGVR